MTFKHGANLVFGLVATLAVAALGRAYPGSFLPYNPYASVKPGTPWPWGAPPDWPPPAVVKRAYGVLTTKQAYCQYDERFTYWCVQHRYGRPFGALMFESWSLGPGYPLGLDGPRAKAPGTRIHDSFQPIWSGLILNTLAYGALFWFVGLFLGRLRAVVRERRAARLGQCAYCHYPIGTSPICTECGRPIPRARTAKSRSTTC